MDLGSSNEPQHNLRPDLEALTPAALQDDRNHPLKLLIDLAAKGDIAAFEALYDSTSAWLLGRIRRMLGESLAEDVLAEVYLQVWRSLPAYDESRGEPLAWLATIARSRALDSLRRERRSHGGQADAPEVHEGSEECHELGPEQLLAARQRDNRLKISIGALSPKEQLVLGMAYFRDCTQHEIAVLTGLPLGTVKTLVARSLQKLRISLDAARP